MGDSPEAERGEDDPQHAEALIQQGIPEHFARAWSASGIAKRNGWYDITTHAVQRLTGRSATSTGDYFTAHRGELLTTP